jgi:hypothetical protein
MAIKLKFMMSLESKSAQMKKLEILKHRMLEGRKFLFLEVIVDWLRHSQY